MRVLPQAVGRQLTWLWPSIVLGALGVGQLHAYFTGQVQGLLSPTFHPFVVISGMALTGLAILRLLVGTPSVSSDLTPPQLGRMVLAGLLLAVVLGFQKTTPRSGYSALAFDNRGLDDRAMPIMSSTFNASTNEGIPPDGQVMDCEVVDLLMAASDADLVKSLEGHPVRFIGQFLPLDKDSFQVVRLMMYCCAADAQPVGLRIHGAAPGFQKMDWVQIEGLAHFIPDGTSWKVNLQLQKISPTPVPKEIFLY